MTFGERLKSRMTARGLTQSKLACVMGVSKNAVNKWIKGGTISMENAIKLANELGVDPAWLLFGAETESSEPVDLDKLAKEIEKLDPKHQRIVKEIVKAFTKA